MAKKKKSDGAQPPSMFDNLDLFDIKSVSENVAPQADVEKNFWQGRTNLQLNVKDIKFDEIDS